MKVLKLDIPGNIETKILAIQDDIATVKIDIPGNLKTVNLDINENESA